ncbi:arf-GAP with dual PH domain-containing protein 1-like [Pollicipes pollicipes]|uniref:arf-GAP with dual PH domain-containing protein 1-like n=1 Tax=Pollicipes pollicipes TaxID=41117 RepID=UPI0018854525|nr:arf-GAP with dual PH domain-containing protein 1-like [Pollicipes pollicipes]
MSDKSKRIIEIASLPGNEKCADCKGPNVEYASHNLGVFLCTRCVAVHRQMGTHISQTKHLKHDRWTDDGQLAFMAENGNTLVNAHYEQHVPDCYRRPDCLAPNVLLEQFIRAKYERMEFVYPDRQVAYTTSTKTGSLFKRGRDSSKFEIRTFVLSESQNVLSYHVKAGKDPKLTMMLNSLNVAFVPDKVGHPNGMQITYVSDGSIRHIYVYHNDGQTVVDWYNAIRNAKLNNLLVAFPGTSVAELRSGLTHDFALEGWLYKIGPRAGDQYRRRWFTLDGRKLMYHDGPLDPVPKGAIPIGDSSDYMVRLNVPPGSKDHGFSFTLRTPERTYLFSAQSDEERRAWMGVLNGLLEQPRTPQDCALAACLRRKQSGSRRGLSRSTADGLDTLAGRTASSATPDGRLSALGLSKSASDLSRT